MMKRFLSLWQGDGGRTLALTVGSPSAHRRCAMLKPLFLAMLFLIAGIGNAWGTKNVSGTYKLVTSVTGIAANDTVILVNKAGDYALTAHRSCCWERSTCFAFPNNAVFIEFRFIVATFNFFTIDINLAIR